MKTMVLVCVQSTREDGSNEKLVEHRTSKRNFQDQATTASLLSLSMKKILKKKSTQHSELLSQETIRIVKCMKRLEKYSLIYFFNINISVEIVYVLNSVL